MSNLKHLEVIRDEFKEIEEENAWNQVYQKIRTEGSYDLSCSAALLPQNKNQNRYKDVLPYDHSRIVLQGCGTDYINASLVEVKSVERKYILCQGPLAHTTPHFWLLIWQENTKGIVMLNRIMEKNQIKCHQYWPLGDKQGGENVTEFTSVNLKVELLKEARHSHYIYRKFRLCNTSSNESREILHFHYTTWSDFGVPQSPDAFYKFLNIVRASQCLESSFGPSVIHCSAGIGRSGTFCLVDSILLMLDKGLCSENPGTVLELLLDMRKYRMGLIQTSDQLRFSYQAILYGAQKTDETNGKDPEEGSSSEDLSIEEAPPLPPPRTDSLTRSMFEAELINSASDSTDDDDSSASLDEDSLSPHLDQNDLNNSLNNPLPSEPSSPDVDASHPEPSPTSETGNHSNSRPNELRRRREERVAAKVATIKEKTRAAEKWHERKNLLMVPVSVCAALVLVGVAGGVLYYYRHVQSS